MVPEKYGLSADYAKESKPVNIIDFISRYAVAVFLIGLFFAAIATPVYLYIKKPIYETSGMIRVEPAIMTVVGDEEETSLFQHRRYEKFINTQALLLRDLELLDTAIGKLSPELKQALFSPDMSANKYASSLLERYKVERIEDTELIKLTIANLHPEGIAELLNIIMETFISKNQNSKGTIAQKRLMFLKNEYDKLEAEIQEKSKRLEEYANLSGTSNFMEMFNIYDEKIEHLRKEAARIFVQRVEAEKQYNRQKIKDEEIKSLSMDAFVEEKVSEDHGLNLIQSWTYQKLQELRKSIDGLAESNKDRQYVEDQMKAMRDYEKYLLQESRLLSKDTVYGKRQYDLEVDLIKAQNNYIAAREAEEEVLAELDKIENESRINSKRLLHARNLDLEVDNLRSRLFKLGEQIQDLKLESNVEPRIMLANTAVTPNSPASGVRLKNVLLIGVFLPFFIVVMIFLAIFLLDNRIRNNKHIESAIGSSNYQSVSRLPNTIPFISASVLAPKSCPSKDVRTIALRLYRDQELNNSKVFLFSGVEQKVGTTSIVVNVSHFVSYIPKKVLIIESNTVRPSLRETYDIDDSYLGLNEILLKQDSYKDYIYRDKLRQVDIIFASANGTKEPQNILFKQFFETVKQDYDMILIDTDPIYDSNMTDYLTMFSDVVLLVCQESRTHYQKLRQTAEYFMKLNVPAIAPILNRGGVFSVLGWRRFVDQLEIPLFKADNY